MKIKGISILYLFTILVILTTSPIAVSSKVNVKIGEKFNVSSKTSLKGSILSTNGTVEASTVSLTLDSKSYVSVTGINETGQTITTNNLGTKSKNNSTQSYNSTKFINQFNKGFLTGTLSRSNNGSFYLTSLGSTLFSTFIFFPISTLPFYVNPSWGSINTMIKNHWNSSTVLAKHRMYKGFFNYVETYYTLGDLFGNATSASIFGATSLSDIPSKLSSNTSSWEAKIDLSGKIFWMNSTSPSNVTYVPYQKYIYTIKVVYNANGRIESAYVETKTERAAGDPFEKGWIDQLIQSSEMKFTGNSNTQGSFVPFAELSSLLGLFILIPIYRKIKHST